MSKIKSKKVLSMNNLPTRFPIWGTITCWLALDHWNAPQWLYGAMGLFFIILWGIAIHENINEEKVDIFKNKDNSKN